MADKIEGFLIIGSNEEGEVVVNHPNLKTNAKGEGHIVFSPKQARALAALLIKCADEVEKYSMAAMKVCPVCTARTGGGLCPDCAARLDREAGTGPGPAKSEELRPSLAPKRIYRPGRIQQEAMK